MISVLLLGPAAGFTVDTMLSILKMIVSGLFDELPNLKVVLGHLGEAIPSCWIELTIG